MEVVVPLGVQADTARVARCRRARVAQIRLGDEEQRAPHLGGESVDRGREFLQEGERPVVDQGVHGVEAQAVQPVVPQPGERAAEQEGADLVRAGGVEVDRRAPGRGVGVGEVGTEGGQVVAGRAEVVVDHVQHHAEAVRVGCVDKALQCLRSAVRLVHGPQRHPLVAPAVHPGERAERHQLDVGDAQLGQFAEPFGRRVECSPGGVRADVELVQHRTPQPFPVPGVAPHIGVLPHQRARAVRAVGLTARAGVGQHRAAVQREAVPGAVVGLRLGGPPVPALCVPGHRALGALQPQRDLLLGLRCPYLEQHWRSPRRRCRPPS